MTLTDITAFSGLFIATTALVWNIIRDLSDKGKLRIDAMIGKMIPDYKDKDYFVLTITNVGRRPLIVKMICGTNRKIKKDDKTNFLYKPINLPQMLKEGECILECYDIINLKSNITSIYVVDSCGKKYYLSRKRLKQLIKENAEQK